MADTLVKLTCRYMDKDYAARNEFDFSCTNPLFMGREYNPVMFDDVDAFCADCEIYAILCNIKKELAKQNIRSTIHG